MIGISVEKLKIKLTNCQFDLHFWDHTQDKDLLKPIKAFSKQIYKEAGYSNYETVDLDNWSKWFYVTYNDEIQATMRIVEKLTIIGFH
ncbi:hypothetical protein LEP1GSC124_3600 [Leptospira interrogans serovar Pyrogenes str. 200701872]|uniref:Uncharacterized protein n=1 Tax=Leptospira interrogans serovar Pyrogenes str. 200701872 TaxID=1193029 RepID=M7ADS2_LEPIR|nr:hypothetical protein LEP1GSC124_3600 [Leptospira interrogans serovar Pyrogenes str. 200701872]